MISTTGINGNKAYGVKEYTLDTVAEIQNLPISDTMGSTAFVIENSSVWVLNGNEQWVLVSASSSSGSTQDDTDNVIYDGGLET